MSLPFDSVSCSKLPDEACGECGWKCDCYVCKADAQQQWNECQCSCRFWVVTCFAVLLGFFIVFYIAAVMRRVLLYGMASVAVLASAGLSAVSASSEYCGWPAFLSIALVFAFPCAYSCCFKCVNRPGSGVSGGGRGPRGREEQQVEAKTSNSVLIVFPGGEVQLGVMTQNSDEGGKGEVKKNPRKGLVSASSALIERTIQGSRAWGNEVNGSSSSNNNNNTINDNGIVCNARLPDTPDVGTSPR